MRLFIAIPLAGDIIASVRTMQQYWLTHGMQGHPTPPENLHLTLAFIGEYPDPAAVTEAIATVEFAPLTLTLDGVGSFRDTFWLGLIKTEELTACVRRIRRTLAVNNIPYDNKRFKPHITLMRKASLSTRPEKILAHPPTGTMTADKILLMRSDRGKNGMIYTPVGEIAAVNRL